MLFIKAGLQTSLQDFGRKGSMHLGVAHSGAMDKNSLALANWLVGKASDSAGIEITLIGPKIQFKTEMNIAICGAHFDIYLNNELVFNNETIQVKANDILEFEQIKNGARAYLAFSGKLNLSKNLNSYSTHLTAKFGGFEDRQLKDNDQLSLSKTVTNIHRKLDDSMNQPYSGNYLLRCVPSVETHQFSEKQKEQFFNHKFKVNLQSNRMGIRLDGEKIKCVDKIQITSSGLTQGSIQITPNGQAIISSVDGQTIGGYPRIANVITADLSTLGQLKPDDIVSFEMVDHTYASSIYTQI